MRVWNVTAATWELFASTLVSSRHASTSSLTSLADRGDNGPHGDHHHDGADDDGGDGKKQDTSSSSLLAVLRHHSAPVCKIIPAPRHTPGGGGVGSGGGGGGRGGGEYSRPHHSIGGGDASYSDGGAGGSWDAVVLTVAEDGAVGVVSLATGRCEMLLPGPPTQRLALTGLLWDAGKSVLACRYDPLGGGFDKGEEEDVEEDVEEDDEGRLFSSSSSAAAAAAATSLLRVWDLPTGTLERSLRAGPSIHTTYSLDSRLQLMQNTRVE